MQINVVTILLLVFVSIFFAAGASGSEPLPEIVVIGDLRVQDELISTTSVTVVDADDLRSKPVSYTHLTLPTICSV